VYADVENHVITKNYDTIPAALCLNLVKVNSDGPLLQLTASVSVFVTEPYNGVAFLRNQRKRQLTLPGNVLSPPQAIV
jgi:hypothetical protein